MKQKSSRDKIIVQIGVILIHQHIFKFSSVLKKVNILSHLTKLGFYIKYYHGLQTANERDLRNVLRINTMWIILSFKDFIIAKNSLILISIFATFKK